jgi:Acetyl-CoA carboxylase, carboxyltransferase component (subunits alpha and beta)
MVRWISFVPKNVGAPLPCLPIVDPVEREVGFYPPQGTPYDPRQLIDCAAGGLLDKGSFVETLGGWAKTVDLRPRPPRWHARRPDRDREPPRRQGHPRRPGQP